MRASPLRHCTMTEMFRRKRNRLSGDLYQMPGAFFVTICARDRARVFWRDEPSEQPDQPPLTEAGRIAEAEIKAIAEGYGSCLRVEKYVVMPNHVHLLLVMEASPDQACPDIRFVVRLYKRRVSQRVGAAVWQKGFHDRIVRNEAEYREIWKYIDENPVKWNLDTYYPEEDRPDNPCP